MASAVFEGVAVTGMSCAVPVAVLKATDCAGRLSAEEIEKFVANTGVKQCHVVHEEQTCSDLCFVAARRLLEHKDYEPATIDALILVTQTPDYMQPATAHILHKRLGLRQDCIAFDINLGCSGHTFGLHVAASMLGHGNMKRILLLTGDGDRFNPVLPIKDRLLFGHAGSATLLETGAGRLTTLLRSDGTDYPALIVAGGQSRKPVKDPSTYFEQTCGYMDGETIFGFSITKVPKCFKEFFEMFNCGVGDFDYFVLHQANVMILKQIAKKLRIPEEKMPIAMDRYGNTSSASVPMMIVDLCEGLERDRVLRLATSGFGVGLSWGVAAFDIAASDVLPMIETDEDLKEAYRG